LLRSTASAGQKHRFDAHLLLGKRAPAAEQERDQWSARAKRAQALAR
jgi:hypothetical protein